jgi:hypothetical protein
MAVTDGTGGTGTVDADGAYIFDASGARDQGCTSIQLWCPSDSDNALQFRVVGLHDADAYGYLPKGQTVVCRLDEMGIRQVHCKSVTQDATVHWAVVAKTGGA